MGTETNYFSRFHNYLGSRVGAVVRALASHQCVPGSIPGPGVICGLSLLLVLALASMVVLRFSSLLKKLNSKFNSIGNSRAKDCVTLVKQS